MSFFTGSPEQHGRVSTHMGGQQNLLKQLLASLQGTGAGGAFGGASDFWQNILNDDPALMEQFFAPEKRAFSEQTIPGLSEQFAGMGAGNLSSSGFRNAAVGAGADLQERLGAIRANLKGQAASGLSGLGQMGLGNYSQDVVTQQGSGGLLEQIMPALAQAGIGYMTGGPPGAVAGAVNQFAGSGLNRKGNFGGSSPYGGMVGRGS